jgi:hypothetical protein
MTDPDGFMSMIEEVDTVPTRAQKILTAPAQEAQTS